MASLRDLRRKIQGVKNIAKITTAMKLVAAAKLRRAQAAILSARPYAQKLEEILSLLVATSAEELIHPLLLKRETVRNILVVVISADRGLCGSFNTNVFRKFLGFLEERSDQQQGVSVQVIAVGKRAAEYFTKRHFPLLDTYPGIFQKLDYIYAQTIGKQVTNGFINEEFDEVYLIYNQFISVMRQQVVVYKLLPIEPTTLPEAVSEHREYIFEPSQDQVLDALLPKHLNMQIWRALLESNAAEQAARMVAMDNATNNAHELIRALQLTYNKTRQATITKELLEIVSGAEALKGS